MKPTFDDPLESRDAPRQRVQLTAAVAATADGLLAPHLSEAVLPQLNLLCYELSLRRPHQVGLRRLFC
jgi:hypothetical protein